MNKQTIILCVIDGLGITNKTHGNALYYANTPTLDWLIAKCPNTTLEASGEYVGLPHGQMGNSEVGHFTIGAGRIICQGLAKINKSDLSKNESIINIINTKPNRVHLIGLVSDGGIHAHINHMIDIAKALDSKGIKLNVHAITDGRDSEFRAASKYLKLLQKYNIKTICGRFYAMDRDNRYERTKAAYDCIAHGDGKKFTDYQEVIDNYYRNTSKSDEFIEPHSASDFNGIEEGDVIIFTNFRADRARQLSSALCLPKFDSFERSKYYKKFYGMMSYSDQLDKHMNALFPKAIAENTIGDFFADRKLKQLRVAETEKYAHVTFFFSGGREDKLFGEDRILIPSPKVKTYDQKPEMSANLVTDAVLSELAKNEYDFICMNYANADMVGHTGDFDAAVAAIEAVDTQLGRIVQVVKNNKNFHMIITADHGNVEEMLTENNTPKTSHTLNPVPLIYLGDKEVTLDKLKGLAEIKALIESIATTL